MTEKIAENTVWLLFVLSAVVTLHVMFYLGRQCFTGAWTALRHHAADMNTIILPEN